MYNPPLNHVTTFGGHPVSAAAAHAALTVLLRDKLMDRAFRIENRVRSVLKSDHITEIRGKGAMLGLQLKTFAQTRAVVEGLSGAGDPAWLDAALQYPGQTGSASDHPRGNIN